MRVTAKEKYAIIALLDIALHQTDGPVSLLDIALRQGISQSYLEQLFTQFRDKGFVLSKRGPGGGYKLKEQPKEMSILRIIQAVNDKKSLDVKCCKGSCDDQNNSRCLIHQLWDDLSNSIDNFLQKTTLADLM